MSKLSFPKMNSVIIGCVWTGEFDLNTQKKSCRLKNKRICGDGAKFVFCRCKLSEKRTNLLSEIYVSLVRA